MCIMECLSYDIIFIELGLKPTVDVCVSATEEKNCMFRRRLVTGYIHRETLTTSDPTTESGQSLKFKEMHIIN